MATRCVYAWVSKLIRWYLFTFLFPWDLRCYCCPDFFSSCANLDVSWCIGMWFFQFMCNFIGLDGKSCLTRTSVEQPDGPLGGWTVPPYWAGQAASHKRTLIIIRQGWLVFIFSSYFQDSNFSEAPPARSPARPPPASLVGAARECWGVARPVAAVSRVRFCKLFLTFTIKSWIFLYIRWWFSLTFKHYMSEGFFDRY